MRYLGLIFLFLLQVSGCTLAKAKKNLEEFIIYDEESQLVYYLVEVADNKSSRRRGLMYREALPANQAMLLKYGSENKVAIWMKNTLIPLDLLFINGKGRIVKIHEGAEPLSERSIYSEQKVKSVLEINAGQVKEHEIKVGDTVQKANGGQGH